MKKYILFIIMIIMLFAISLNRTNNDLQAKSSANNSYQIYLSNKVISFPDQKPANINGEIFVPIRIVEQFGYNVKWLESSKEILITNGEKNALFKIGSNVFSVDGQHKKMNSKTELINNRTMIPINYIGEVCNYKVDYRNNNNQEIITLLKGEEVPKITEKIPVLMYHHLELKENMEDKPYNASVISVEDFTAQMDWLYDNGYNSITLKELYDFINGTCRLPEKSFVITFDDGYASNYIYGYEILKKYNFVGTIFMITNDIGETKRKYTLEKLSWIDTKSMTDVFEFHSHTNNLHKMSKKTNKPALVSVSKKEVQEDTKLSIDLINKHIPNQKIDAFAYPYGTYNYTVIRAIKYCGIDMAFTTHSGYAKKKCNLYKIPRFGIKPDTTMDEFISIFQI